MRFYYFDYIKRVKKNAIAKKVKLADLEDNSNIKRMTQPIEEYQKRMKKYEKAKKLLNEA